MFFLWPAGQALWQSVEAQDAFGFDPLRGLGQLSRTAERSALSRELSYDAGLQRAGHGDRAVSSIGARRRRESRTARKVVYQTLLIWPYAVPPAIAAVLWSFLFNPSIGLITYALRQVGITWNHAVNPGQAMFLVVLASVWQQISYNFVFFSAGLQAIPRSLMEVCGDRRRRAGAPFLRRRAAPAVADHVLSARRQHRLRVLQDVPDHRRRDRRRARASHADPRLQDLCEGFKSFDLGSSGAQSVILMAVVIGLTVIQFRYLERRVEYG